MLDVAARTAEEVFIPYTVGGGMRSAADIRAMLAAGADKISMNSAAVADPGAHHARPRASTARSASSIAIDARRVPGGRRRAGRCSWPAGARTPGSTPWRGPPRPSASAPARSCSRAWTATARRTASTSTLTRAVTRAVNMPVIASGGAGELDHFAEVVIEADADAVLAASVFHFGEFSIRQVKEAMAAAAFPFGCRGRTMRREDHRMPHGGVRGAAPSCRGAATRPGRRRGPVRGAGQLRLSRTGASTCTGRSRDGASPRSPRVRACASRPTRARSCAPTGRAGSRRASRA